MKQYNILAFGLCLGFSLCFAGCENKQETEKKNFIEENIRFAENQTQLMLQATGEPNGKNYPRTMKEDGELAVTGMYDWTPGFFPGSLWYLYELTQNEQWKAEAEKWTTTLEPLKTFTGHHDLGFMMYCSYGNAERLAPKPEYKDILIESARSLSSRFSENTQTIKSWNYRRAWHDSIEWFYPVIIDNMMNLEMLFYATKVSGDSTFYNIAVKHADSTIKNHFREDFSTYHVVDYDTTSGAVLDQATCQGYSDNSTWTRGQAWAIYGFTMMYRETKDKKYLDTAIKATDMYLKNLPEDLVPLWDFNVDQEGYIPEGRSYAVEYREKHKDASAAAIVCSALFELAEFAENTSYRDKAVQMLHSLASPEYRAPIGENADFLLMHCVGSIPHRSEIDKPLVYADYYFLEALVRYNKMK
ncbi:MAG: glycoside hydrolase family 88 protein [Bacteroidales bacterium]|nr:glycoside hydrolase family 88 protein [Bacteroidales bacterium]